ncbi:MAG TPA: HAD family hydrolase [Actinomycetota bacterium]|nr:HAD family hydrolase [Actinomycetota bacterium]
MVLNLIFDADDTLWENNVLFERAIEAFIDHLAHPTMTREQVRAVLDEIERSNCRSHGYGVATFHRSLGDTLVRLRTAAPPNGEDTALLERLCHPMREGPVEVLPGVAETLAVLASRHRLLLLTKGHPADQHRKLDASGLRGHFQETIVVEEKDPEVYRSLVASRGLEPSSTWMIGNSPMSDIWPALEAGLGAVLVPHPHTWVLERRELPPASDRFVVIDSISDLLDRF